MAYKTSWKLPLWIIIFLSFNLQSAIQNNFCGNYPITTIKCITVKRTIGVPQSRFYYKTKSSWRKPHEDYRPQRNLCRGEYPSPVLARGGTPTLVLAGGGDSCPGQGVPLSWGLGVSPNRTGVPLAGTEVPPERTWDQRPWKEFGTGVSPRKDWGPKTLERTWD